MPISSTRRSPKYLAVVKLLAKADKAPFICQQNRLVRAEV